MKKYTILTIIVLLQMNLFAQVQIEKNDSNEYQVNENFIRTYRIFPTVNISYLIKLNTRTGQMWQIEFDQKKSKQQEIPLSNLSLVEKQNEVDNRFTLYATENNWNFLLLDQISGKIWQVKWNMKPEKNTISPLNNASLIENKNTTENRFILYPTINMWNFLLLDKINGNIWQVRWDIKSEKGEIIPVQ